MAMCGNHIVTHQMLHAGAGIGNLYQTRSPPLFRYPESTIVRLAPVSA
jgi:hypothetical protein